MAVFTYKALATPAGVTTGTIVADTPRQARDQLRARGLTVQDVAAVHDAHAPAAGLATLLAPFRGRGRGRVSSARSASFIRELATLLGVGIPLLEAVDTISRQHRGAFRTALLLLRDRVAQGQSLAEAMRELPGVFDELTVSVTDVGENAGTLDTVLEQLADFKDRALHFRGRVASALLYPLIVLLTGVGVSVFLMTFVVPQLLSALLEAGRELPWSTRVVKGISDALLHHGWLMLLALAMAVALLAALLRTRRGRHVFHRLQLNLPGVGELIRKQAIARVATVMATLLRSGIVFERSVEIAQRSVKNLVLRDALERMRLAVHAGRDIAPALEATGAFPAVVVQVFAVGQQSGRLEEMLDRLATDYDRQVTTASQRLTSVLEPLLILALAVIVGFIAFATVLPILEAGNVL